ncbi:MAG: hypothetical protein GX896_01225 [Clostridiales bacterium]|nr:hypothetical protein [Clostridiales bacterium]
MDKLFKKIYEDCVNEMNNKILLNEEYSNMTDRFYGILDENLSKKERQEVDVLMGKILSFETETAWVAGSRFSAKAIVRLLK